MTPGNGPVASKSLLVVGFGYLGRRVAHAAQGHGFQVAATSRKLEMQQTIESAGCRFVRYDINSDSDQLPAADAWVWCPGFDRSAGVSVRSAVVDGLRRALDRTERAPRLITFTSTTSVYGQSDGRWVDESSPCEPLTESGNAHREAERAIMEWADAHDSIAVNLRLSGLYGPGRTIRRQAIEAGEPIPCRPESWLNLLHIDDAASACIRALRARRSETFCVTDDRPVRRREYYETLARLLGAPAPRFVEPTKPDFSGDKRVSNRRIKTDLGWQPTYEDFVKGLSTDLA